MDGEHAVKPVQRRQNAQPHASVHMSSYDDLALLYNPNLPFAAPQDFRFSRIPILPQSPAMPLEQPQFIMNRKSSDGHVPLSQPSQPMRALIVHRRPSAPPSLGRPTVGLFIPSVVYSDRSTEMSGYEGSGAGSLSSSCLDDYSKAGKEMMATSEAGGGGSSMKQPAQLISKRSTLPYPPPSPESNNDESSGATVVLPSTTRRPWWKSPKRFGVATAFAQFAILSSLQLGVIAFSILAITSLEPSKVHWGDMSLLTTIGFGALYFGLFIAAQVSQAVWVRDAARQKSTVQVIAVQIFNTGYLGYLVVQLSLLKTTSATASELGMAGSSNALSHAHVVTIAMIPIAVIFDGVGLYLAHLQYKIYGRTRFVAHGASIATRKRVFNFHLFMTLLKLNVFFNIGILGHVALGMYFNYRKNLQSSWSDPSITDPIAPSSSTVFSLSTLIIPVITSAIAIAHYPFGRLAARTPSRTLTWNFQVLVVIYTILLGSIALDSLTMVMDSNRQGSSAEATPLTSASSANTTAAFLLWFIGIQVVLNIATLVAAGVALKFARSGVPNDVIVGRTRSSVLERERTELD
ncbi:hypothetical protein BJ742DRAFT_432457 [Cladochytrium replicatum]|nr:hypothetical protein BJ742DRAFT_432457 [Cladochytrium replicatum]